MPLDQSDSSEPLRTNLRASLADGASYSVMVALGETNFQIFAVALAAGETLVGLVATVPMMLGAVVQLLTPWALSVTRNFQHWVVGTAALQAASLLILPLAVLLHGNAAIVCVLFAATLYWAGVLSCSGAWNTWIEGILPISIRTRYLASRARVSQASAMIGFLLGGIVIQTAAGKWLDRSLPAPTSVLVVFVTLFIVAALARFISAGSLALHRGPYDLPSGGPTLLQFFTGRAAGPSNQLIFYLLAMQAAVQISGPFFMPYMLKERNINPFAVVLIFSLCFLGKAVAMPLWGRIAQQLGARRLFWLGGSLIAPVSAIWIGADWLGNWQLALPISGSDGSPIMVHGTWIYFGAVQFLSGVTWSAYELAMSLMFLEAVPREHRTRIITYYNFGNASAMMLGSLIGGTILWNLAETQAGYMVIFGLSSVMRLCVLGGFAWGATALLRGEAAPVSLQNEETFVPAFSELRPQLRVFDPEENSHTMPLPNVATAAEQIVAADRATAV